MPRIRTIKPEFFQDEDLAQCSPRGRLLAIALLQLADVNGVFRNIPMQVHAHAFPWESEVNTPALLGELEGVGFVNLYSVGGKEYGYIPGFGKHQRVQGKEAQSEGRYPLPDQALKGTDYKGGIKGEYPSDSRGDTGKGKGKGTGNREEEIPISKDIGAQAPDGSDDIPPSDDQQAQPEEEPDAKKRLFDMWLGLVGDTQVNRRILGKALSEHTEDRVIDAVVRTVTESPLEPVSYLQSCLRRRHRKAVI